MAFQTNVLRDGTWITENVNVHAFLSAQGSTKTEPTKRSSPTCGLLTRTIVESPVVQWIFPVRLRSAEHNDVAFIGDWFVQIKELRGDGQLHDVARKMDFRSRILNAQVLGSFYEDSSADGGFRDGTKNADVSSSSALSQVQLQGSEKSPLPPQLLVLVLESGQLVFLFLRQHGRRTVEFVSSTVDSPRKDLAVHPGFHFAVDPSSRYMVTATSEGLLVVYELEDFANLRQQYRTAGSILSPVTAYRPKTVMGVIHKVEFLFPAPGDFDTIILVLLVVRNGVSRMITYEWALGDDLNSVLSEELTGFRLPPEHKMPLLLIPLTVKTSFLSVSESSIAVFRDILHGSSNPELVNTTTREKTIYHHGSGKPLWTAWTRPLRRKAFYQSKDNIYLAREDGIIFFFEIDSDEILESSLDVGDYSTSISTAFATVADTFSDILILGGSCGDGSIWALPARERPEQIGVIPNWSPVLDFTTTDECSTWDQAISSSSVPGMPERGLVQQSHTQHDRLFSTSCCGINGSVTELVHGTMAHITLDVEYSSPLRHVWVFPDLHTAEPKAYNVLLGLHNRTVAAQLTLDLSDLREPSPSDPSFDMSSKTLAASQVLDQGICQVTETSITLLGPSKSSRHAITYILGSPDARAENACIRDGVVAFSSLATRSNSRFDVHLVASGDPTKTLKRYSMEQEVTCVQLCTIEGRLFLIVAVWQLTGTSLLLYAVDSPDEKPALTFDLHSALDIDKSQENPLASTPACGGIPSIGAVTNLVVVLECSEKSIIVGGTRGGYFLQLDIESASSPRITHRLEKLGTLPIDVLPARGSQVSPGRSVFVCCGTSIALLDKYDVLNAKGFRSRSRLVPVDGSSACSDNSLVASVARIPSEAGGPLSLLMTTGTRLLVTRLGEQPAIIPRKLPLRGTPSRLIYSHVLECLVVAVNIGNRPTLIFLDPDTGQNLSWPTDRNKNDQEFISGLGRQDDWVHCLDEWIFKKDGKTFSFILVTTNSGRLLIISAERVDGRVRFWTRHKKNSSGSPIYSVSAIADNIFFCVGTTIHWEILDVAERKIREHAKIELVSPATSMNISGGRLYALTQTHSLEIVNLDLVEERRGDNYGAGDSLMEQRTRPTMHMIDVGDAADTSGPWPITLLSDRECGITGVWMPRGEEGDGGGIHVVFEAELPASVRRFRRGHMRPTWWRSRLRQKRYGRIPSTPDDADVLGMCLDGSMHHFTLLTIEAWRFLKLVQMAATREMHISKGQSFQLLEPTLDPKLQLHVNGDVLYWCWQRRELERLFEGRRASEIFKRCLDELDGGQWTKGFKGQGSDCSVEGHTIMEQGDRYRNKASPGIGEDKGDDDDDGDDGDDASEGSGGIDGGVWDEELKKYMELGYEVLDYYMSPVL